MGEYGLRFHAGDAGDDLDPYTGTGNDPSFAAGRLSYVFGAQGRDGHQHRVLVVIGRGTPGLPGSARRRLRARVGRWG